MSNKKELKVGDQVSGKNLNGKPIAGEIVNIPRLDPSIAHVATADPAQRIHNARLSELTVASAPAPAGQKQTA